MKRRDFLKGVAASAAAWPLTACDRSVRTFGLPNTYSVAFAPDGRTALSGAGGGSPKLWELATGREVRDFVVGSIAVYSVALSPDGRTALSGDHSGRVKLWELATGKLLRNFWDANLVLHSGNSNSDPSAQYATIGTVNSVAFSPDGHTVLSGSSDDVLSGSSDETLKLWEVATGKLLRTFPGHPGMVHSVAFSPDGLMRCPEVGGSGFGRFRPARSFAPSRGCRPILSRFRPMASPR